MKLAIATRHPIAEDGPLFAALVYVLSLIVAGLLALVGGYGDAVWMTIWIVNAAFSLAFAHRLD